MPCCREVSDVPFTTWNLHVLNRLRTAGSWLTLLRSAGRRRWQDHIESSLQPADVCVAVPKHRRQAAQSLFGTAWQTWQNALPPRAGVHSSRYHCSCSLRARHLRCQSQARWETACTEPPGLMTADMRTSTPHLLELPELVSQEPQMVTSLSEGRCLRWLTSAVIDALGSSRPWS